MATKSAKKKKKERTKVSAKKWADNSGSFKMTHLRVPEGLRLLKIKDDTARRFDLKSYIVPEECDAGPNPNADPGSAHFERTYYLHHNIGSNNDSYVCPRMTAGKKCPVCDHRKKLQAKDDTDEEVLRALGAQKRQLFLLEDVGPKSESDEDMLWDVSFGNFGKKLKAKIDAIDEDDEDEEPHLYFADPEDGFTLKVAFTEESFKKNTYYEASDIEFKARKEGYDPDTVESNPVLDSMLIVLEYDELQKIFLETSDEDDDDDDEDDKKTKSKKSKSKAPTKKSSPKGKSKKQDDDDDEDDDDEDDDDEDEDDSDDDDDDDDKPAKKSKGKSKPASKSKSKKSSDDDDDDDDDDKPAKGKAKGGKSKWSVGDYVLHKKHGLCEVVSIGEGGNVLKLEDEDGEVIRGVKSSEVKEAPDEDEDDDDDDAPAKGKSKSKASTKSKSKSKKQDDDDDEDDDTDDDDDEDDEDDKPAKKSKTKAKSSSKKSSSKTKSKSKKDDDWDEDDDDSDDDDDDDDD